MDMNETKETQKSTGAETAGARELIEESLQRSGTEAKRASVPTKETADSQNNGQETQESEKLGLIQQILRFGIVGIISFLVDSGIYTLLCNGLGVHYLVAGIIGFVVSVVVNYLLSMRFVFRSRDDISKTREFITFVILSTIGLGLNELILYLCIDVIYAHWNWLSGWLPVWAMNILAKIGATGIVMIYNFVSRKIFLEKKD